MDDVISAGSSDFDLTPKRPRVSEAIEKIRSDRFDKICDLLKDDQQDEVGVFFASLATSARKFPMSLVIKMKLEMQTAMNKLELEYLKMEENN